MYIYIYIYIYNTYVHIHTYIQEERSGGERPRNDAGQDVRTSSSSGPRRGKPSRRALSVEAEPSRAEASLSLRFLCYCCYYYYYHDDHDDDAYYYYYYYYFAMTFYHLPKFLSRS